MRRKISVLYKVVVLVSIFISTFVLSLPVSFVAFASKARMAALGQDTASGSHYIVDNRMIFKNPAAITSVKNYIITEWGTASDNDDPSTDPHAEGELVKELGAFVFGGNLGSEIRAKNSTKTVNSFLAQDNRIDLFFGGYAGYGWGFHGYIAKNEDNFTTTFVRENTAYGVGFGYLNGKKGAYLNLDLKDESIGAAVAEDLWAAKLGVQGGATYGIFGFVAFFEYTTTAYDQTLASVKSESKDTDWKLGLGKIYEIESTGRVFTDFYYNSNINRVGTTKTKVTKLPLTVGFEVDVKPWLVARGSIKQNIWIGTEEVNGKAQTLDNSTEVAAGATLNFSKLKVDGVVGQDKGGNKKGTIGTSSRISVSYNF